MSATLLGLTVRLTLDPVAGGSSTSATTFPGEREVVEGVIYAYDDRAQLVTVCTPSTGHAPQHQQYHVRIIRASRIGEVVVLDDSGCADENLFGRERRVVDGALSERWTLPAVNLSSALAREDWRLQREEERYRKRNRQASALGQAVFDALDKTLPCTWQGVDIVVLDAVRICEPYDEAHAASLDGNEATLQRVVEVLRKQLSQLRESAAPAQAPLSAAPPAPSN
ncbi:hypothetical protein CDCA_CDCA16G4197 [Cyanidium caldarium]|uniref:AD domain-containing protein n=1 Tax=Cyanidium caldarium TaxID=2771 RepID=A0AAV9J0R1_CYACA|nr:hypothetical protein CDCA_CDCA16G4197 [Cyanidium caldarium]